MPNSFNRETNIFFLIWFRIIVLKNRKHIIKTNLRHTAITYFHPNTIKLLIVVSERTKRFYRMTLQERSKRIL